MTAGLPGLRTVPSPLAPRLRAGADLHVHTTHADGLCSPCEVVIGAAARGWRPVGSITTPPADLERLRRARPANPSSDSLAESLKF